MSRENRSNTDMEKSNFSVQPLEATADLIMNTQKFDCFFQTPERMQVSLGFQSK
jgi:hypothetical protein